MLVGTVKSFNASKGYGSIEGIDGGADVVVRISGIK